MRLSRWQRWVVVRCCIKSTCRRFSLPNVSVDKHTTVCVSLSKLGKLLRREIQLSAVKYLARSGQLLQVAVRSSTIVKGEQATDLTYRLRAHMLRQEVLRIAAWQALRLPQGSRFRHLGGPAPARPRS